MNDLNDQLTCHWCGCKWHTAQFNVLCKKMNHQDFDKTVSEIKEKHPFWFESADKNERIPETDIERVERSRGISFTEQYRRFISIYGVGEFAFTNVYSPLAKGELSLWEQKSKYALPEDFIPISDNGCGDYLGLIIRNGKCSDELCWADHENNYATEKAEYKDFYQFILNEGLNKKD